MSFQKNLSKLVLGVTMFNLLFTYNITFAQATTSPGKVEVHLGKVESVSGGYGVATGISDLCHSSDNPFLNGTYTCGTARTAGQYINSYGDPTYSTDPTDPDPVAVLYKFNSSNLATESYIGYDPVDMNSPLAQNLTSLSDNTKLMGDGDEDISDSITLPFTTNLFGKDVNEIAVGNNGFVVAHPTDGGTFDPHNLKWETTGNRIIDNFVINGSYANLYPAGNSSVATIKYATFGSAPHRSFVVEFYKVPEHNSPNNDTTFQIKLDESSPAPVYPTSSVWDNKINNSDAAINQKVVQSSSGNYYVAWEEETGTDPDLGSLRDIKLAKLNSAGILIGSVMNVTNNPTFRNTNIELAADANDGVFMAYVTVGKGVDFWNPETSDVIVSHYSSDLIRLGSKIVEADANQRETVPQIMFDGLGGVFVAFYTETQNYFMTRLGSDCEIAADWNPGGTTLGVLKSLPIYAEYYPGTEFVMLNSGAITGQPNTTGDIIWAGRSLTDDGILAGKLDKTGAYKSGWTSPKYAYSADKPSFVFSSTTDGNGGLIVAHMNNGSNSNIRMTHLDKDGVSDMSWGGGTGTVEVENLGTNSSNYIQVINDQTASNNIFLAFNNNGSPNENNNISVYKYNSSGTRIWASPVSPSFYTPISNLNNTKSLVPDGNGGVFIGFTGADYQGANYIQHLQSSGARDFGNSGYYLQTNNTPYFSEVQFISGGSNGVIAARIDREVGQPNNNVYLQKITSPNSDSNSAPTIASIAPVSGGIAGGTTVTIMGNNFLSGAGSSVTFGGIAATGVSVTTNSITATTPAHSAGAVSVVVTNPDSQIATSVGGFTYTSGGGGSGNNGNTKTGEGMVVIDCGNLPQMDVPSNLEFDSDLNTAGVQHAFISDVEQTTHAIQPSIKITDSRTNESSCNGGNIPVTLTVKVNSITDNFCRIADGANPLTCDTDPDEGGPLLGDQKLVNEVGVFSALSFTGKNTTTCTGCGYYSNSIDLTNKFDLTSKNFDVPGTAITLFSNPTGFNGVANLPALDYSLIIPPNSPAGTFKAAITYELSYT